MIKILIRGRLNMKVNQIMKSQVISVRSDEDVGNALDIMKKENINGIPVVDGDDKLIGMIVKADIYRFLMDPGHIKNCPVEWVMTKEVVKGEKDEEIEVVAKRLRDHDIIALPIVQGSKVIGIVSIEDFVDYYIGR